MDQQLSQFSSASHEKAFLSTNIGQRFQNIRDSIPKEAPPTNLDWRQCIKTFRDHFPSYYSFITYDHNLSINQYRYCILVRLGFDGTDIGVLMDKDRDQRHNLRRLIYEELFGIPVQVRLLEEKLKPYF